MSHEAICPCNLQCNFCRNKYCSWLQLGCQTYATCFATCNEIIFYARPVFKNVVLWLVPSQKKCETSCSEGVTRYNLSRSIAKSRSCFYFLCNLQRNFSLRDCLQTRGVTRGSLPCNLQCNAIALQVTRTIASCDMALTDPIYFPESKTAYCNINQPINT